MTKAMVGTRYGSPVAGGRAPNGAKAGVRQAMPGGDWLPDHCSSTNKVGHACMAKPVKGTTLCYGHSRSASGDEE